VDGKPDQGTQVRLVETTEDPGGATAVRVAVHAAAAALSTGESVQTRAALRVGEFSFNDERVLARKVRQLQPALTKATAGHLRAVQHDPPYLAWPQIRECRRSFTAAAKTHLRSRPKRLRANREVEQHVIRDHVED
jgi:hypothetical protein